MDCRVIVDILKMLEKNGLDYLNQLDDFFLSYANEGLDQVADCFCFGICV